MKKHLLLALLLCISQIVFAQLGVISGVIIDSVENQNLKNASVVLLNATDSVLIADTRTNANGQYVLNNQQLYFDDYLSKIC